MRWLALIRARWGGKRTSVGATSGIAIAITLGIAGYGDATTIATYGFCGLLAGLFSKFGKLGATLGFIIGNMVLAFYANGSTEVIVSIKEILVASVVLFFLPRRINDALDEVFDYTNSLDQIVRKYFNPNIIYRLNGVSEVIDKLSDDIV